jgi:tagatose 1,6-diphosphate aldolase
MAQEDDLYTFKRAVVRALSPMATTLLVDATLGPRLLPDYAPPCAPMMAFEADVYRIDNADRITVLPDDLTVADYPRMGVRQLKLFLWYSPDDDPALNARKLALVERVGRDCAAQGLMFLMEPLVYHPTVQPGTAAFAAQKPALVRRAVETFADPRFGAHILKVEVPVDLPFVEGFGQAQTTRADALAAFRAVVTAAAGVPVVFLSSGVPFPMFEASLALAHVSGTPFAGFMCGRALWSEAVAVFGAQGEQAVTDWLMTTGRDRLARLIAATGGGHAA